AWNERAAEGLLPDYKAILGMSAGDERLLSAPQIGDTHAYASTFIEQALRIPHDGPTVVVTHYAPHPQSVSKQFRGSGLNPAFVSDLSPIIERYAPDLWVHGHMHESFDYRVGRTRVVCNPRGCGTENPGWNPVLVVEV
ncbi:MAG: metallophosphoesterase, partial [Oricola sp.]|nr:metallophosphoesterase [Oricola sp.]